MNQKEKFEHQTKKRMSAQAATTHADNAAELDAYKEHFTNLFHDELFALMSGENMNEETVKLLSDCIETGRLVWGHPLRLPDEK